MSIDESVRTDSPRVIIDAQNFSAPPVATVHLPRRVPYGAHGSWVTDDELN
jgi:carotenoid cleavage dioxygenase-like enzyme